MRRGVTSDRRAVAKALDGHLCRCTGYGRIIDAIQTAGDACRNGGRLPRSEPRRHLFFGEEFGLSRNPAFVKGNGANNTVRLKADTTDTPKVRLKADATLSDAPLVSGFSRTKGNGNGIGTCTPRLGGLEQSLGERPFVGDLVVPGMLHGAVVLSEHPRARVVAIRTAAAMALPGVVRVLTAADVPGQRGTGLNIPDLPVFVAVGETTCCVGDFLAMVVADTTFRARQAAEKIEVDYEVLEPITDPFAALEPGAPRVHPPGNLYVSPNLIDTTAFSRGDVDAAVAASAHVIQQTFVTQPVEPAFLEPEACLALPQGKGVKVHTDSQGSIFDQRQIAKVLNLPLEEVEIALAASGGAFGAKEELSIQAQTALAAYLLGCPVKTVLTRKQSTQHHVKRHPMTLNCTVGADAEGRLLAVRTRIVGDAGGYAGTSGKCLLRAAC